MQGRATCAGNWAALSPTNSSLFAMNEVSSSRYAAKWRWFRVLFSTMVCFVILAGGVAAVVVINQTEPIAEKKNLSRKSSALVETIRAERGTFRPRINVLGTVQSAQQISLSPRVSGQVLELSPNFVPGGMVEQGALLVRLDPADFENALSISLSELRQAEASMEIELARQRLAEKELNLLAGSIDETNRGLVMREPQIASIRAEVSAAEAAVERAKLDLERTRIFAPFDAHVLSRSVDIGSQVGLGDDLGQLVGLEEYWIMAAVPVRSLRWIEFADDSAPPSNDELSQPNSQSRVILRNSELWGPDVQREAVLSKLIGTVDQQTRLARVLIRVKDPLSRNSDLPPLIINTMIDTEIEGRPIANVIRLNREFLRDQDTVWVMKDEKLEIRRPQIEFRDAQYAYIVEGLEAGEEVVTTTLATVVEGIGLKKNDLQAETNR